MGGARIPEALQGHVRVRVGGLLVDDPERPQHLLLAEHDGLWEAGPFWTPPGGGVEFGEGLGEALTREIDEETGLAVAVGPLRYVLDFVRPPLHAVSFYFQMRRSDDGRGPQTPRLGADPELDADDQLLRDLRWVRLDALDDITLYPEPLAACLPRDIRSGFPEGLVHLGTFR